MSASRALSLAVWILAGCGWLMVNPPQTWADEAVTSVSAKVVSKEYIRTKLPDGSYQPEEYLLKDGGRYDKPCGDASIDQKSYQDIARVMAEQLGTQNYRPATGLKTGKLIIVVFWGMTIPPDPGANHAMDPMRERYVMHWDSKTGLLEKMSGGPDLAEVDFETFAGLHADAGNAGILGYDMDKIHQARANPKFQNLYPEDEKELNELEGERYFVVLMAYDLRAFLMQRKYQELWETRFSISTHNTDFTKALAKMAKDASNYFGRDSHGLQHLPAGSVKLGEVKSLGEVEPPRK